MKFNFDKKMLLTLASAGCGIGSVIVGLLNKSNETDEAAEKAAKIVMDKMKKSEQQKKGEVLRESLLFVFEKGESKMKNQNVTKTTVLYIGLTILRDIHALRKNCFYKVRQSG